MTEFTLLVRAMARELADHEIRVNSIRPGWIDTRLGTGYLDAPERRSEVIATIPIGRVGSPRDIGTAAMFLASDDASYMTGAHLRVDGAPYRFEHDVTCDVRSELGWSFAT